MIQNLAHGLLPALLIFAAFSDVMTLRIPNWLTVLTGVLFFPLALMVAMPWPEFGNHLISGLILFIAGFAMFQFGLIGGGDAKLMAAAGLWFGTGHILQFLVLTALAGGVLALALALWSILSLWLELDGKVGLVGQFRKLKLDVPYGLAFAIGGILAFKETWWFSHLV